MSGIVGYVGVQPALDVVLAGLGRLADAARDRTPPGEVTGAGTPPVGDGAAGDMTVGNATVGEAPVGEAPVGKAPALGGVAGDGTAGEGVAVQRAPGPSGQSGPPVTPRGAASDGPYRPAGCDSAGVAVLADGGLATARTPGTLDDLSALLARRPLPSCGTALGHLRTATSGRPTERNTHPQLDSAGRVAVVHIGTLTNGAALRAELAGHGHRLTSGTDTEAVAQLLAEALSAVGELGEALRLTAARLEGGYAVAAVHADDPDALAVAGHGLPLVAAVGDGEAVLASAVAALPPEATSGERLGRRAAPWRLVGTADTPGGVLVLRRSGDELRHEVPAA